MSSVSLVVLVKGAEVALVLFGTSRLPQVVGDLAKAIRSFKKGKREDAPPIADRLARRHPPLDQKAA